MLFVQSYQLMAPLFIGERRMNLALQLVAIARLSVGTRDFDLSLHTLYHLALYLQFCSSSFLVIKRLYYCTFSYQSFKTTPSARKIQVAALSGKLIHHLRLILLCHLSFLKNIYKA